jgi:hypothetical protein
MHFSLFFSNLCGCKRVPSALSFLSQLFKFFGQLFVQITCTRANMHHLHTHAHTHCTRTHMHNASAAMVYATLAHARTYTLSDRQQTWGLGGVWGGLPPSLQITCTRTHIHYLHTHARTHCTRTLIHNGSTGMQITCTRAHIHQLHTRAHTSDWSPPFAAWVSRQQ